MNPSSSELQRAEQKGLNEDADTRMKPSRAMRELLADRRADKDKKRVSFRERHRIKCKISQAAHVFMKGELSCWSDSGSSSKSYTLT